MKKTSIMIVLFTFLLFPASIIHADTPYSESCWYRISTDYEPGIAVREAPVYESELLTRLPDGTEFFVMEVDGVWGYTYMPSYSGWINLDYAEQLYTPPVYGSDMWYVIDTDYEPGIAVRSIPSGDGELLTRISDGTEFYVEEVCDVWGFTSDANGYSGWIHLDYAVPSGFSGEEEPYWDKQEDWSGTSDENSLDYGVVEAILDGNIVKLGTSFSVDLNNDGVEENVFYDGNSSEGNYYEGGATLYINDMEVVFTGTYYDSDVYGVSLDGRNIFLIVYDMGPSDDPVSTFLEYDNDEIYRKGIIYDWPGDMNVSDGIVYCKERCNVVDTGVIDVSYEMNDGILTKIDQDYYTINNDWRNMNGWDEYYAYLTEPLYVYEEPDYNSEAIEIYPQNVRFPYTDGYAWAYVEGEDGTGGWFDFSSISMGEKQELFQGLLFAD